MPQVWELGVKEVWRVAKPLDRVIHTMGWPLRPAAKYREFGGSFIYPMGPDHVAIGMVVGLDYRDVALSVHDLLQELKTHPKVRPLLEGGERLEWGAKTIPGGGFHSLPTRLHAPGLLLCGDGAGLVNIPTLKGVHYAVESGRLAAEAALPSMQHPERRRRGLWLHTTRPCVGGFIGQDLRKVRDMRQVFGRGFFVGGALARRDDGLQGRLSLWAGSHGEPDATQPLLRTDRDARYPGPRRQAHLRQALVGVRRRATRHETTSPTTSGWSSGCRPTWPRCGSACARPRSTRRLPPAMTGWPPCISAVELRAMRRYIRQGWPPDAARGRLRPRIPLT